MKRNNVLFFCLLPLALLLAACGDLVMEIDNDGSGKVSIEIPNNEFVSAEMVESELAETEGISRTSVKENGNIIEVEFQFDELHEYDSSAYQIPVGDYVITNDERLENLTWDGEIVEFEESTSQVFIQLPDELYQFDTARIILPGEVTAHSDNVEVVDNNTIEISSSGTVYAAYEPKANTNFLVWGGVIVLVAGAIYFYRRKKHSNSENTSKEGEAHA